MLKKIKLGFLAFLAVGFLMSCQNDSDSSREAAMADASGQPLPTATAANTNAPAPRTPNTPTTAPNNNANNVVPAANTKTPAAPVGPTTSIKFNESEFDFGTVEVGEKVRHEYKFKNTGKEPLIISNAKASCGCTVPDWPKTPIQPGEESSIMVEFDSKGKNGPTTKTVTITANTDPPQTIVKIKGNIKGQAPQPKPTTPPATTN